MTGAQVMISRLKNVHETSNGWDACCPSHEDKKPSLSVSETDDGKVVFHCHAGCSQESVLQALGIKWADLFPTKPTNGRGQLGEIIASYDYTDEEGNPLFQVVRFSPKDFRQRRPDGNGGWIWSTKDTRKVLYHLPKISSAIEADQLIFIVEGEEDVHSLERLGLSATTNPGGATKWRDEYSKSLREAAEVVILPDNDDVGRTHAEQVATSLHGVTLVKVLELPGLPEHGDVRDWLRSGGTVHELFRLEKEAPEWKRPPLPAVEKQSSPSALDVLLQEHRTDLGNARRFVALFGEDVRYCWPWKKWLVWDGRRFDVDETGEVFRLAKKVAEQINLGAWEHLEGDKKEALAKHALRLEKETNLREMLSSARSEVGIPVIPGDLDSDPWLLNCLNGVLDLRTGKLHAHNRKYLMCKLAPVEYHPDADCPTWRRFLQETTGGDKELEHFLQVVAGYSLTGDVSEEKVFFVYGPPATGKSTFLEALGSMLGDYAATADFDSFLSSDFVQGGRPRSDIARLVGIRFVRTAEAKKGRAFEEGLIKRLSGGDALNASRKYQDEFEFHPQFKLFLASNDAPTVRDDDEALWRRLLRVPFSREVAKERRDKSVKKALTTSPESRAAILAWSFKGCDQWQRNGIPVPPAVDQSTQEYREENDPLKDFLSDCCVLDPQAWATVAELRRVYGEWCREEGVRWPLSPRAFAGRLRARGCIPEKFRHQRGWRGIGLLSR